MVTGFLDQRIIEEDFQEDNSRPSLFWDVTWEFFGPVLKMGPIGCPETKVTICQPARAKASLHGGGSLKSRKISSFRGYMSV
jgi:hypothetical protein